MTCNLALPYHPSLGQAWSSLSLPSLLTNERQAIWTLTLDQSPYFHLDGHMDPWHTELFSGLETGLQSVSLTFLLDESTHQTSREFVPYPQEREHYYKKRKRKLREHKGHFLISAI